LHGRAEQASSQPTASDIAPSLRGIGPRTQRITYNIKIRTRYPRGYDPASKSGYGRGTTEEDIKSGNVSTGFHEGQHGTRILDYLETQPLPKLNPDGRPHTSDFTWRDAAEQWRTEMDKYNEDLEEHHVKATDCVGHESTYICK